MNYGNENQIHERHNKWVLPWAGQECLWDTWRCRSGTDWRLTWWTCRVRPPAHTQCSAVKLLSNTLRLLWYQWRGSPGRRKAAGANISTAEGMKKQWKKVAAAFAPLQPPLPLLLQSPCWLCDWGSLWFPGGRKQRRERRSPTQSMTGSGFKYSIILQTCLLVGSIHTKSQTKGFSQDAGNDLF